MEVFRNINSSFKNTLDKVSKDKVINKNELNELKKIAKTEEEKKIVGLIEKQRLVNNFVSGLKTFY